MVTPSLIKQLRLRVHPVDAALTALLLIATITAAAAGHTDQLTSLLRLHAALLAGCLIFTAAATRWSGATWVLIARPILAAGLIYTLYSTLGRLGMAAMPYRADALLSHLDTSLFGGTDPALFVERWQSPGVVEFFALCYGLFIPYLNLSLLLGCLGRPPLERDRFLTGWVLIYCISYLGYLFIPATGPGAFLAAEFTTPLSGGWCFRTIERAVADSGGSMGAFPSLHVGASLYLCLFDLRTNRLRGLTYLPLVILIYAATIILRYHYVVDLIAGTLLAFTLARVGPWVFSRWAAARQSAGLPALPGGEGDVLPAIPNARDHRPASVFSSD